MQGLARRAAGGTGGEHIIHQRDMRWQRRHDPEGALHVRLTLGRSQRRLHGSFTMADQRGRQHRKSAPATPVFGQFKRLVETPLAQTAKMQRYRHQRHRPARFEGRLAQACQQAAGTELGLEFEMPDHAVDRIAVFEARPHQTLTEQLGRWPAGQSPMAEQAQIPLRQTGVAAEPAEWWKNPVIQVLADSVNKIHWRTVDGLGYPVQVVAPRPSPPSENSHDRCHPT